MNVEELTNEELREMAGLPPATMADRVQSKIKNTAADKRIESMTTEQLKGIANVSEDQTDFSFGEMVSNIPGSAMQYGKDIYQAVTNPVETVTGLGRLAGGVAQKFHPDAMRQDLVPYADAAGEYFSGRYGGMGELSQTAMTDPVGLLGDVAGGLSGVGMLPKMGKVGKLGGMLDPINAPLNALPSPSSMYQGAAKFYKNVDAPGVTGTALERGIMPTTEGMVKAQGFVTDWHNQVNKIIDDAGASNKSIKVDDMLNPLQDLRKQVENSVDPNRQSDLSAIDKIIDGINESKQATGKNTISVREAQDLKQRLQGDINWNRSAQTADPMTLTAQKEMAKGVRQSIEQMVPEVKGLNLQQSDMLDLMDALEGPVRRIERRNMIGIETPITTGVGGVVGSTVGMPMAGAAVGAALGILDQPTVKARLAIEMNRIQKLPIPDAQKRALAIEAMRIEVASEIQTQDQ